ncbi:DUF4179 domain-containing protein [Intestinimonas sp.]|uniref:DUF4179 domain-containing protein n=1 Tax=Intestinimonas sp. TaxID=1965293 RepID=UPI00262F5033|nr:DUF4179 domain-containing protein [Intestinimonas sp.]
MNRNEEYWALVAQLHDTPPELSGTVERARARTRKRTVRRWLGIPVASLGGAAAAFVLLINCSLPFAMACGRIPLFRELAAAVALSPSLKAAVENDFVQVVDQEQTQNGVTFRLDYLILDAMQINFFYTVSGGDYESYHVYPNITGPDGEKLEGYSIISSEASPGELGDFNVNYAEDLQVPEALRLTCKVTAQRAEADGRAEAPTSSIWDAPEPKQEPEVVATFTFDLELDERFTVPGETIALDRWVEVEGQRLHFRELVVNPTHARLAVSSDPDNTAWLDGLDFYLEDEKGNRYEAGVRSSGSGRLVASGADGTNDVIYYYLESSFFQDPKHLTLYLTGARWLDKDKEWITVDLNTGAASWLPEGVEFLSADRQGEDVWCTMLAPGIQQLIAWDYRDPEGGEHSFDSMGSSVYASEPGQENLEEELHQISFALRDYPWDTVELKLNFTHETAFDPPIAVELQ